MLFVEIFFLNNNVRKMQEDEMSATEENKLLKMIIETQASPIVEQEATIKELRKHMDELV